MHVVLDQQVLRFSGEVIEEWHGTHGLVVVEVGGLLRGGKHCVHLIQGQCSQEYSNSCLVQSDWNTDPENFLCGINKT